MDGERREHDDLFYRFGAFMGDRELVAELEQFLRDAKEVMNFDHDQITWGGDVNADTEFHNHENYEIYQDYCKLVETKFEGFLAKEGVEPEEFYAICKEECEQGGRGFDMFMQFFLASMEFDAFVAMVKMI